MQKLATAKLPNTQFTEQINKSKLPDHCLGSSLWCHIYMYACTYIYTCVYMRVCVCMHIHLCARTNTHLYTYIMQPYYATRPAAGGRTVHTQLESNVVLADSRLRAANKRIPPVMGNHQRREEPWMLRMQHELRSNVKQTLHGLPKQHGAIATHARQRCSFASKPRLA